MRLHPPGVQEQHRRDDHSHDAQHQVGHGEGSRGIGRSQQGHKGGGQYGANSVRGVDIGQEGALFIRVHIGDNTVHQAVHGDAAQARQQGKGQHQAVAGVDVAVQRDGADEHRCHTHKSQAQGKAVDLIHPLAVQAQQDGDDDTADRLDGEDHALLRFVDAEESHHGLGLGAEAVEVNAVGQEGAEAQHQQGQYGAGEFSFHNKTSFLKSADRLRSALRL